MPLFSTITDYSKVHGTHGAAMANLMFDTANVHVSAKNAAAAMQILKVLETTVLKERDAAAAAAVAADAGDADGAGDGGAATKTQAQPAGYDSLATKRSEAEVALLMGKVYLLLATQSAALLAAAAKSTSSPPPANAAVPSAASVDEYWTKALQQSLTAAGGGDDDSVEGESGELRARVLFAHATHTDNIDAVAAAKALASRLAISLE
jgi:hypothetical protein